MGKNINMEPWQLDLMHMSTKGKGHAGRDKFDGSQQDHSIKVDLRGHIGIGGVKPPKKKPAKKRKQPTVFEYLKRNKYLVTYVEFITPPRIAGSTTVNTMVVKTNGFLFDNQIKRFGDTVLRWYYENKEGEFSQSFSFK